MTPDDPRPVLELSPFLQKLDRRYPDWLPDLASSGRLAGDLPPRRAELDAAIDQHGLDAGLRRFRNREMLRITWRELAGTALLEQTLNDLTVLAEHCLDAAIDAHHAELTERFGTPRDSENNAQQLVVLGLGKLGGRELNLSSDIDLILCFPSMGHCDGRRGLANEQFFTRLARAVINSLSKPTEDGFCFRVDTRLRPFGEAGPLVCSFGALEQYYQREGRDWERYALIKARPVAGDRQAGERLLSDLAPFVYRRYIDFGAVEALQDMLGAIRADAARQERGEDVKRGPGGIREVEFLVQCFQLLRGGRETSLRTPSLAEALAAAGALALLPEARVNRLEAAYGWLRRLENAIQAQHDQQTHRLPTGEDLDRIVRIMDEPGEDALRATLAGIRSQVTEALEDSFPARATHPGAAPEPAAGARDSATAPITDKVSGKAPDRTSARTSDRTSDGTPNGAQKDDPPQHARDRADWTNWAADLEQRDAPEWADFLNRIRRLALSGRAEQRLDAFMALLLGRLYGGHGPDHDHQPLEERALGDVQRLILAICRRSAYLALLVQNPAALDRMLELFGRSEWVAATVIRHPALLDELIDPALGRALPDRAELARIAARMAGRSGEEEQAIDNLNYIKRAQSLRIAVAELEGAIESTRAEMYLTELAEVLVSQCLALATAMIAERHGTPEGYGMAIIAYGSLGAGDMSYGSDLDLVFLYPGRQGASDGRRPLPPETWYTRLVRRLLALATTVSPSGRLYEIDTRLRPNGRSGLLVSPFSAFERYQLDKAWVWEWQALTRARPIAGGDCLTARFAAIRERVLARPRDPELLRSEIPAMRERMRGQGAGSPWKHGSGGLLDIDFLAQLGVLELADRDEALRRVTDTRSQLDRLGALGWLPAGDARTLIDAHIALTRARHFDALSRSARAAGPDLDPVIAICERHGIVSPA